MMFVHHCATESYNFHFRSKSKKNLLLTKAILDPYSRMYVCVAMAFMLCTCRDRNVNESNAHKIWHIKIYGGRAFA